MPDPHPPAAGPEPLQLPAGVHQLCGGGRSRRYPRCDGSHHAPVRQPWGRWR